MHFSLELVEASGEVVSEEGGKDADAGDEPDGRVGVDSIVAVVISVLLCCLCNDTGGFLVHLRPCRSI